MLRYVYITFLRDPVYRYLSEYKHVQRGATWKGAKLKCNGRSAAGTIVPFCYSGQLALSRHSGVFIDRLYVGHTLSHGHPYHIICHCPSFIMF